MNPFTVNPIASMGRRKVVLHCVLLLVLLVLALATQHSSVVDAKKTMKPRSAPTPTPEATSAPKSARDNDPEIQAVRGLRNAAMRENDQRNFEASIEKLRDALTKMNYRVFGEGRAKIPAEEQSQDAALYAQLLGDYGTVLIRAEQYDEAIDVLEDAVEMTKRVFGESHPSLGLSLRSLADALLAKKKYNEALAKYKTLRSHIKKGLGVTHEGYIEVQLKIAEIYKTQGSIKKAVKLLRGVLDDQGPEVNGATAGIGELYMELATLQLQTNDIKAAEGAALAARMVMHTRDGAASLNYAFSLNTLAGVRMAQGKVAESYSLLQEAHAVAIQLFGRDHAMVRSSATTLQQVKLRLEKEKRGRDVDEHIEL